MTSCSSGLPTLLGQARQGDFRWLSFTDLAWGPFPIKKEETFKSARTGNNTFVADFKF